MDQNAQNRIKDMVTQNKVMLFMKGTPDFPQCGFSAAVVDVLNDVGVPYAAFDVLSDPAIRQGIKDYANWPTIPQLYVGGEFVGGCDIVREMQANGELEPLLKAAT
jgi:monothiol glutaredoxin